jgi:hypothetical protein
MSAHVKKEKMKVKKNLIVLTFVLITFTTIGVSLAKQQVEWTYYAYGTLDNYHQEDGSAEVVSGIWNLKVLGDRVWFNGYYLEKNMDDREDEPVGSIDIFEWELDGKPTMYFEGDVLVIIGNMKTTKTVAMHDGTYKVTTGVLEQTLEFDFSENTFLRDVFPPEPEDPAIYGPPPPWWQDWDMDGTILYYDWPT